MKDMFDCDSLHNAARKCDVETIQLLVKHKAYINMRDVNGVTPLILCAASCDKDNVVRALKVLLEVGANVNICDKRKGHSALQVLVILNALLCMHVYII